MKTRSLFEITKLFPDAKVLHCPDPNLIHFTEVRPLSHTEGEFLAVLNSKAFVKEAKSSLAKVIVTTEELAALLTEARVCLIVKNAELALIEILNYVHPPAVPNGKISPHAIIAPSAKIGSGTQIGHFVTIGENAVIGNNCIIADGVKIENDVSIGDEARIGMNCVFYHGTRIGNRFTVFGNTSIGGDGFGFTFANGKHNKIPQVGKVVIGDDVEVGSNCTIDRGALTDTIIGNGCKFDNMVHIAHNCKIGNHVIIAGQSGLAGSVTLGNHVIIGGACAISDHLTLVDGTIIAGGSSLRTSPKTKDVYIGWDLGLTYPEFQKYRVNVKNIVHLNKWIKRIKDLESKLGIQVEDPKD
ncbi:UDP-3-O-[3-hydroxymyristoyl] glucosamine N-acyltransferase [Leptospira ryugenii]|uniref:UDP-3-O-[3-hydroxymyristoyl] glucosamine N-acyltransferase n=1 Tax=Leptospira ryugenii TaxID=1917863 RepID=A0A2P2DZK4_9LEPT|nr:UDP-3-O-(3-hydroxymyristoyl)glucosamine N-acyltransferase [Leptospira ryugenii]GBF50053.1 UDP-3-O-[3-hydroxymyristoyl] glucosamine N-acyltransferase [Leptospira ryugenii]